LAGELAAISLAAELATRLAVQLASYAACAKLSAHSHRRELVQQLVEVLAALLV
jgi:hypothetical protein